MQEDQEEENFQTLKMNTLKRKSSQISKNDDENENDIYESENIPRTKKLQKMEIKKRVKKEKKNGKLKKKHFKFTFKIIFPFLTCPNVVK